MDFSKLSLTELKAIAKEKKMKGVSALKKDELAALLAAEEKKAENTAEKKAETKEKKAAEEGKAEKKPVRKTVKKQAEEPEDTAKPADTLPAEKAEAKPTEAPAEKIEAKPAEPVRPQPQGQVEHREMMHRPDSRPQMHDRPQGQRPQMHDRPQGQRPQMHDRPQGQRPQMQGRPQGQPQQHTMQTVPPQQNNMQEGQQLQRTPQAVPPQNAPQQNVPQQPAGQPQPVQPSQPTPQQQPQGTQHPAQPQRRPDEIDMSLDSGMEKSGILEVMEEGYGFIRCDNFMPGNADVYVSPYQLRKYGLRTGDVIKGNTKIQMANEKFAALLYIKTVNGHTVEETQKRKRFENLTPIFPNERLHLENPESSVAMRMVDLIAPVGKGQRGMIVSQPKSGKTTLLKQIATSITKNHPDVYLIILLIDERPEEVTDMKDSIKGDKVEIIYSTFDEEPIKHQRVSNMVIEHAKRLVEYGSDVVILVDSLTRMARACNLTCTSSGRTLSGGLDPAALGFPKKFFGAARNMREGGSLTILATALVETGSRMDDVVFEEFKGTGNMELVLNRDLSERRIFPAIDLKASGTRREDLLLSRDELEAMSKVRRALNGSRPEDTTETLINMCAHTRNNFEFVNTIKKTSLDGRLQ